MKLHRNFCSRQYQTSPTFLTDEDRSKNSLEREPKGEGGVALQCVVTLIERKDRTL